MFLCHVEFYWYVNYVNISSDYRFNPLHEPIFSKSSDTSLYHWGKYINYLPDELF